MTINCSRFRFLLQQRFDIALAPQDERMVTQHMDSCDSCGRFQHQIDQVCQAALEVPLPEECLPASLEALAGKIMQTMPTEKQGFLSAIKGAFGGGGKKDLPNRPPSKGAPSSGGSSGSGFPHVSRGGASDTPPSESPPPGKRKPQVDQADELLATSTRLRNLAKIQPQSDVDTPPVEGSTLAKKMGMEMPSRQAPKVDGPANLAETIKQQMAADHKPVEAPGWGTSADSGQNPAFLNSPAFGGFMPGFGGSPGLTPD